MQEDKRRASYLSRQCFISVDKCLRIRGYVFNVGVNGYVALVLNACPMSLIPR